MIPEYSIWMDRGFWALVSAWFVAFGIVAVALLEGGCDENTISRNP